MRDKSYPHTGWFVVSESKDVRKEYCYELDHRFVTWTVKETRSENRIKTYANLIFIQKPFHNIWTITAKRSLFFAFKSYVVRNRKGTVAGFYCPLKSGKITIFHQDGNEKQQTRFSLEEIGSQKFGQELKKVANIAKGKDSFDELQSEISSVKQILTDSEFMFQLHELDDFVEEG